MEKIQCYINKDWREMGHARVAILRQNANKSAAAVFLVDLYCLGVKDIMAGFRSTKEFELFLPSIYFDGPYEATSIDLARNIVWGAVQYARSLGFEPHHAFEEEQHLLGEEIRIPPSDLVFGGPHSKPMYIIGPNDASEEIIQCLERKVGKDGFDVISSEDFDDE